MRSPRLVLLPAGPTAGASSDPSPDAPAAPAARAGTASSGGARTRSARGRATSRPARSRGRTPDAPLPGVLEQLERIERDGGDGILVFERGVTLPVSSLDRLVWKRERITKGALMRYYAQVAPMLLPSIKDRPLALERWPAGVGGASFHQHDPGESVPPAVRVADVMTDAGAVPRFIGGDIVTLLYTIQLGAVAVDAWHSRLRSVDAPDWAVLDLDPGPRVPFSRVCKVALHVGHALDALGLRCALKTSGSRGLHLVVPLPARTTYETAAALAEDVAQRVAAEHPALATLARAVDARPKGTVYVDHLQNARGKTLATAFSARARPGALVSAPITWAEVEAGVDPRDFTVGTVPELAARLRRTWETPLRAGNPGAAVRAAIRDGRRTV